MKVSDDGGRRSGANIECSWSMLAIVFAIVHVVSALLQCGGPAMTMPPVRPWLPLPRGGLSLSLSLSLV